MIYCLAYKHGPFYFLVILSLIDKYDKLVLLSRTELWWLIFDLIADYAFAVQIYKTSSSTTCTDIHL